MNMADPMLTDDDLDALCKIEHNELCDIIHGILLDAQELDGGGFFIPEYEIRPWIEFINSKYEELPEDQRNELRIEFNKNYGIALETIMCRCSQGRQRTYGDNDMDSKDLRYEKDFTDAGWVIEAWIGDKFKGYVVNKQTLSFQERLGFLSEEKVDNYIQELQEGV